jgi:hypothetical protein
MRYVQGASPAALRQASGLPGSDDRFHAPSALVDRDGAFDVPGRFVKAALRAVLVVRLGAGFPRLWSCGSPRGLG